MAQVDQQGNNNHHVTQKTGQNRRPNKGLELFQLKDIYQRSHKEGATADGDSGEQIKADPKAPRVGIAEVADRADPNGDWIFVPAGVKYDSLIEIPTNFAAAFEKMVEDRL